MRGLLLCGFPMRRGGRRPSVWDRPVRVRNDPGASELVRGWAHTRTGLGMCWSRYVLLGPGSSFARGPSGIAEMPNRRSFQDCAAKHMQGLARKYPGWVPDPAGEPENPGRPLYCLPEYSPRVWIGGRMCVTHTCGLAGAAGGGTPQKSKRRRGRCPIQAPQGPEP